jgi:CO/xanthine dehydrogenase Mo-binding subunit
VARSTKQLDKREPRLDAVAKVTGAQLYPSDKSLAGMLYLAVVRSPHPHARVLGLDTREAEAVPGVVRVLTARDVPGENAFGIAIQDQPVLCGERVRYQGDAVALVGAESLGAARAAAALVRVDYEVLEPVVDPELAMRPEAPALHPGGNILHQGHFTKGDVRAGFRASDVVIAREYDLPMMEHAYLETEAGIAFHDELGRLTVDSCGQYVYRDQTQIARALGLPLERVRAIGSYAGGAFGGKDEITVQIHLALMTHLTGRPSKLTLTREESLLFSTKRHAARVRFKTGCNRQGELLAVEARFVADTGAYASLGGPVLNLMLEHVAGPYRVPHVKVDGYAVYTNNGVAGAFRGFGCTQACVGIESQMDLMAREIGLDPLAFRLKNAMQKGDRAALDYEMKTAVGARATIRAAQRGRLWKGRQAWKKALGRAPETLRPYLKRGVGAASQMQGLGLGIGLPDYCEVALELSSDGRLCLRASTSEFGQGAYTAYATMLAERLGVARARIEVVGGDTGLAPDSGTTTASRSTYAVGNATLMACDRLEAELGQRAAARLGWPEGPARLEGAQVQGAGGRIGLGALLGDETLAVRATYHIPVADVELGDGLPHLLYSYGTHVAGVEVNTLTGEVTVQAVEAFLDGGQVILRTGFEGQSEGGVAQGIGYALFEKVEFDRGRFLNTNFNTYVLPTSLDVPASIRTVPVVVREPTGPFGAKGMSETAMVGVTPAILNALEDALGVRFTELPVRAEQVLRALSGGGGRARAGRRSGKGA